MVEEECRRYRPTKNYLEQLPSSSLIMANPSFETPMLKREIERLNARLPPEPLSMKRFRRVLIIYILNVFEKNINVDFNLFTDMNYLHHHLVGSMIQLHGQKQ